MPPELKIVVEDGTERDQKAKKGKVSRVVRRSRLKGAVHPGSRLLTRVSWPKTDLGPLPEAVLTATVTLACREG